MNNLTVLTKNNSGQGRGKRVREEDASEWPSGCEAFNNLYSW